MTPTFPSLDELATEANSVIFDHFDEIDALALGQRLMALAEGLAVVINIRTAHRTLFHAATIGSGAINDNWARRKSNTALMTGKSSLAVGVGHRATGRSLAEAGLDSLDYADHGGAVPVIVKGVGMVAVATVSGLPQLEDHALVMRGLRAHLAQI